MKFKVGDRVRVTKDCGHSIGTICEITKEEFDGERDYFLMDKRGYGQWVRNGWYELATPSLPINITFNNKYEHQAVQQFLFDNGCKWCCGGETSVITYFNNNAIQVTTDKKLSNYMRVEVPEKYKDLPTFTINDLDTIKEILNPSKPITEFKLNSEYTATIDPNTNIVKVGCQSFAFETIKELAGKL